MDPPSKPASKKCLEGPKLQTIETYGGLGVRYLDHLYQNLNKIHQIDTVTGVTETNGSVRSRAIQIAIEMRNQGIVENDIILVCSRCHADQTIVVLASFLIGAIVAPLDPNLHHKECIGLVKQLKPKICFCDLRTLKQIERVIMETGLNSKMVHFGDQQQYAISFRKLLMSKQHSDHFDPINIEQPRKRIAFILPTQGVTGPPKLVCLSHHFIYTQTLIFHQVMSSPEKLLSFYSLSWIMQVILMCLCFEVQIVRVLTGTFQERTTCKTIQDLKIDHVFLNTDLAIQLVEHVAVRDFNLSCLRCVFIGSLSTTFHDINKLVERLPKVRFTQLYCTTEVGAAVACSPIDYLESLDKTGAVGKVVQNYKLRVVDINSRTDVEPECCGELLVAGDCMMLGYFKNLQCTKASMQQGYFKTGDIARYDPSGWIYVEGRVVDLINIKGTKVSPREIEDIIMTHPFVKDTAVISNDKEIVACVIVKGETKITETKLLTFISERVPVQKWPTRIIFMNDFPTTPLGKIKRDVLREEVLTVKIEYSESDETMPI
ncbi:4-coumarate--CoA ligase 1-like, partial [Asbolus verrucosus]